VPSFGSRGQNHGAAEDGERRGRGRRRAWRGSPRQPSRPPPFHLDLVDLIGTFYFLLTSHLKTHRVIINLQLKTNLSIGSANLNYSQQILASKDDSEIWGICSKRLSIDVSGI
jgi:hypothetical protein